MTSTTAPRFSFDAPQYPHVLLNDLSDEHGADCLICGEEDSPCITNVYVVTEDGDVELLHTCAKLECIEYAAEYRHAGDDPALVEVSTLAASL